MTINVAIIGRPNVGKSTLFNRLVGRKVAIVHDMPGVTRDRKMAEATLRDLKLRIVDTAGYEFSTEDNLEKRMWLQTKRAIAMSKNALEYLTGVDVESQKFVRLQGFSMQGLASMESNARKSKPTSDITESKQPQALDSDNVCALRVSNKGVSGDLPQANCTNLSESSLVYKKGASPSGVNEVAAPNNNLDSIKSPVCTRSGVSGDLLPTNDSNLSETNCGKNVESSWVYRICAIAKSRS